MNQSRLGYLADPLREMLEQHAWFLERYRSEKNTVIVGIACDVLPVEFLHAAGALALRFPPAAYDGGCGTIRAEFLEVFDVVVRADGCASGAGEGAGFIVPGGYGEEHAFALGESMDVLLRRFGLPVIREMERSKIVAAMEAYNVLRRLVRGICSVRNAKPELLSQEDLYSVMSAAACLPPDTVTEQLAIILQRLNAEESILERPGVPALVHSCMALDPALLDDLEDRGCLVVEDDACGGRRQFDLSFNTASADPVREILEAYSYKPLCPSLRSDDERHELFYKLLKSFGIELVIFIDNGACARRGEEIEVLRKKMMRQGVDPLAVTRGNAVESLAEYFRRAGGRLS